MIPAPRAATPPRRPAWTRATAAAQRARTAQALVTLAFLQGRHAGRAELLDRLRHAEAEAATLRLRADLGVELARKVAEIGRINSLLLADDDHAHVDTEQLDMRAQAAS